MVPNQLWKQISITMAEIMRIKARHRYYCDIYRSILMDRSQSQKLFLNITRHDEEPDDRSNTVSIGQLDPESLAWFLRAVINDLDHQLALLNAEYNDLVRRHKQEVITNGSEAAD